MKITRIQIRNYMAIAELVRSGLGKFNLIKGGNGVGKTAILKAIRDAFKSAGQDPHVIQHGKDEAEILVEVDRDIVIRRRITPSSNTVRVVEDDKQRTAPQGFLDQLIGPFNFNPSDFLLASAKERRRLLLASIQFEITEAGLRETLGDLPGPFDLSKVDYSKHGLEVLQDLQKDVYERRAEENRNRIRLEKAIEQDKLDIPDTLDTEQFEGFDLQAKINEISKGNMDLQQHQHDVAQLYAMRTKAKDVQTAIQGLQTELAIIQETGKMLAGVVEDFISHDNEALQAEIDEYQQVQKLQGKLEGIKERKKELGTARDTADDLDRLHKALVGDVQRKILSEIDFPIENLQIKGDDIFVDGTHMDKLATSEQVGFSLGVAQALAGDLKVICIDRFESMDPTMQDAFAKQIKGDGFQYFVTEVTDGELSMETAGDPQ